MFAVHQDRNFHISFVPGARPKNREKKSGLAPIAPRNNGRPYPNRMRDKSGNRRKKMKWGES